MHELGFPSEGVGSPVAPWKHPPEQAQTWTAAPAFFGATALQRTHPFGHLVSQGGKHICAEDDHKHASHDSPCWAPSQYSTRLVAGRRETVASPTLTHWPVQMQVPHHAILRGSARVRGAYPHGAHPRTGTGLAPQSCCGAGVTRQGSVRMT